MDKYAGRVQDQYQRGRDLQVQVPRLFEYYQRIFETKIVIAQLAKSNQCEEFKQKSTNFDKSFSDQESAHKFINHFQTVILPATLSYSTKCQELQTVFRNSKAKANPKKKGSNWEKVVADFAKIIQQHQQDCAELYKEILRHLTNAELFMHTSQIDKLTQSFSQLSQIDTKKAVTDVMKKF